MRNSLVPLRATVLLFLLVFAMPLVAEPQNGLGNGGDPRPRQSGRRAPAHAGSMPRASPVAGTRILTRACVRTGSTSGSSSRSW